MHGFINFWYLFLNSNSVSFLQLCPEGFYCPNPTELPKACPLGYYSNSTGETTCKICPEGSRCDTVSSSPIACASGYYSAAGNITCTACPSGYKCVSGAPPTPCAIGMYGTILLFRSLIVPTLTTCLLPCI